MSYLKSQLCPHNHQSKTNHGMSKEGGMCRHAEKSGNTPGQCCFAFEMITLWKCSEFRSSANTVWKFDAIVLILEVVEFIKIRSNPEACISCAVKKYVDQCIGISYILFC